MVSKHFEIHELVPEELYHSIHEKVLWRMIPDAIIETIDTLKEHFSEGTMKINDYEWSGNRRWSGLRTVGSRWYSYTSMHTTFDAIDCVFSAYDIDEVRKYILANPKKFPHITRIEAKVSWLHFDTKKTGKDGIITFNA